MLRTDSGRQYQLPRTDNGPGQDDSWTDLSEGFPKSCRRLLNPRRIHSWFDVVGCIQREEVFLESEGEVAMNS